MELSVTVSAVEGLPVVAVGGDVDLYSAPELRDRVYDLLDSGHRTIAIDLSNVSFLDSTGIGVLVGVRSRAEDLGGAVPLVCPNERILKLFAITNLDSVFSIHDSVDALVESTSKGN